MSLSSGQEPEWRQKLAIAEEACRKALASPELEAIASRVQSGPASQLAEPEYCYSLLATLTVDPASASPIEQIKQAVTSDPFTFERWILLQAVLAGIKRADSMPVFDRVKALWADEAISFAQPPAAWRPMFSGSHVRYREMARIATWRRFPAGQFHWEIGGFPKSYLSRTPPKELPRVLFRWLRDLRGFAPFWEAHINDRRKNRLSLTESEGIKSYYLMARSLELQSEVLGFTGSGWLHSPATSKIAPQLAWMRELPLKNGAIAVSSIGPAPRDAGFMVGSEERRRLYEEGQYRPTIGYILWPRRAAIAWAKSIGNPFA